MRYAAPTRSAVTRARSSGISRPDDRALRGAAREPLVRDPVRPVRLVSEQLVAALLVGLEVALEPHHLRVALERQHVRRDAVQEPAVVGDDDGAPGEAEQRLFESA